MPATARRISGGSIEFDGMELTTATEAERRALRGSRIAYVAQSAAASFNPAHKIIDQHTEAPVHYRIKKRLEAQEDAMELYERLRLPNPQEIGFRYPHQVSGGQLQRAMTAMAMACRPDLIIFDEPTTALDVTTQIEVLAAIRDIVDQFNTAAIYITHDLAVVAQMADTIKVLLKGEEVEEASTEEMLDNPQGGLHQEPLGGAQLQAAAEVAADRRHRADHLGAEHRRRLYRRRQGARGRVVRHLPGHDRRRRRRIRIGQVDHGALHHRAAAADRGRDPVQGRAAAAATTGTAPRISCARRR